MAVVIVNQFTKDKRWHRLQELDAKINKLRRECRELYDERFRLVGEIYGGDAYHGSNPGTPQRGVRDR